MELGKATSGLIADWSRVLRKAFEGFWAKTVQLIFGLVLLVAIFSVPHLVWPRMNVKMSITQMGRYDGHLTLVGFDLENGSYLDLKSIRRPNPQRERRVLATGAPVAADKSKPSTRNHQGY